MIVVKSFLLVSGVAAFSIASLKLKKELDTTLSSIFVDEGYKLIFDLEEDLRTEQWKKEYESKKDEIKKLINVDSSEGLERWCSEKMNLKLLEINEKEIVLFSSFCLVKTVEDKVNE